MEKRKLTYSFALAFLLVVTSIIIFSQSDFSKFNLTGFVTNSEGIECDGNWTQTLGECINGSQTITWTSSDSTNCTSSIIETQSCEMPISCSENWTCDEWTTCADSLQTRTCSDLNSCGTTTDKPSESQSCEMPISCSENWTCDEWTTCADSLQTRTCSDLNSCGTTTDKPSESQSCDVEETEETQQISTTSTLNQETPITTTEETTIPPESTQTDSVSSCTPNWKCGEWQECLDNKQVRVCLDTNSCNSQENIPPTSQECISKEVKATCSDKIKNQGELNVDCGGPCKKCGVLTLVGSVISGDTNKEGSLLRVLTTILGIIVIAVVVAFGAFFLKHNKKQKISSKNKASKK